MSERETARENVRRQLGERPSPEPLVAAMYGFLIALVAAFIFRFLVSPDPDPGSTKSLIAAFVCAAIVGLIQWRRCDWYDSKVAAEEMRLWDMSKR